MEEEEEVAVVVAVEGPRRERSSMKFPTARFEGVRGRCRVRVMSYGWRDVRDVERWAVPWGWPLLYLVV